MLPTNSLITSLDCPPSLQTLPWVQQLSHYNCPEAECCDYLPANISWKTNPVLLSLLVHACVDSSRPTCNKRHFIFFLKFIWQINIFTTYTRTNCLSCRTFVIEWTVFVCNRFELIVFNNTTHTVEGPAISLVLMYCCSAPFAYFSRACQFGRKAKTTGEVNRYVSALEKRHFVWDFFPHTTQPSVDLLWMRSAE